MTSTKEDIRLSVHARQRMDQMMVDEDEVIDTIRHPEYTYPMKPEHGPGLMYVRGRLAVPVSDDHPNAVLVVRTVLWALSESREAGPTRRPVTDQTQTQTESVVPKRPSNRSFYNKLVLWGFKAESQKKDKWKMKREHPDKDTLTIDIYPPRHSAAPSGTTFMEVYKLLGVTDEEFWGRTTPVPKPKPKAVPPPKPKFELPPPSTVPVKAVEPAKVEQTDSGEVTVVDRAARKMISPRTLAVLSALPPDGTPIPLSQIVAQSGMSRRDMGNAAEALHRTSGFVERSAPATYRFTKRVRFEPPLPTRDELLAQVANEVRPEPGEPKRGEPITIDLGRVQPATREFLALFPVDGTPIAVAKLATQTSMDRKAIYNAIDRLVRSGRLVKHSMGLYGFPGPVTFVNGDVAPTHSKPAAVAFTSNGVAPTAVSDKVAEDAAAIAKLDAELAEEAMPAQAESLAQVEAEMAVEAPVVPQPAVPAPTVTTAPVAPKPVAEAMAKVETHSAADIEEEIDAVFDALFPEGLKVRSADFGTVAVWRAATKVLLDLRR